MYAFHCFDWGWVNFTFYFFIEYVLTRFDCTALPYSIILHKNTATEGCRINKVPIRLRNVTAFFHACTPQAYEVHAWKISVTLSKRVIFRVKMRKLKFIEFLTLKIVQKVKKIGQKLTEIKLLTKIFQTIKNIEPFWNYFLIEQTFFFHKIIW